MATVSKRETPAGDRWVADYRDSLGKRRMKFFMTKREADAALDEVKAQLKRGRCIDPNSLPTFAEVARAWLDTKRDKAPSSVEQWRSQIETHLIPAFGDRRIDQVTVPAINQWKSETWNRDTRAKGKLARSTLNGVLGRLRSILEHAIDCEYIERNPGGRVKGLVKERKADVGAEAVDPSKVLDFEQSAKMLAQARPGLERTFMTVGIYTGCRVGELQALRWSDIDLDAATLTVRRSLSWKPGEKGTYGTSTPHFGPPKTEGSRRTIDLTADAVTPLKAWWMSPPARVEGG